MTLDEAYTVRPGSFVRLNDGRTGLIAWYMQNGNLFTVTFYKGRTERLHYTALTVVPTFMAPIPSELPTTPTPGTLPRRPKVKREREE